MKIGRAINFTFILALTALVRAQTPAGAGPIVTKTLMVEPLGDNQEPKVTVLLLPVRGGLVAPAHTHPGPVFAYILQGDIENQVDPDPPKIYHPGDFFYEAPMHVHRLLRNLSQIEPASLLVFQVGATGKANPAIKRLLQEPADVTNREGHLMAVAMPPGSVVEAHKHPGPVFAYIVRGEVENQVEPEPPKVYRAGDLFYEAPGQVHRFLRNSSKTEPAQLIIFEVGDRGLPLAVSVEDTPR